MKYYSLFGAALLFILFTGFAPQQPASTTQALKWYGWNEGYAKAVKEGKIVLVDAYTDWCGWCKKMDKDTYTNADVIKRINENFIPIKFNPEIENVTYTIGDKTLSPQELYYSLTQGNATGFPTTYFIFPKRMSIFYDAGYRAPDAFIQVLDVALSESKK
ncbi:MAG: DUF255 domain-containing protein [Bacteroidia bacterium]|jgi:uncharacterized protein YyaL (SSP411 family)|nr:DUF255 domain-containing protein [Bacteroidia bacterium]